MKGGMPEDANHRVIALDCARDKEYAAIHTLSTCVEAKYSEGLVFKLFIQQSLPRAL